MASYTDPPEESRGRRDLTVALVVLLLAITTLYLPQGARSWVAEGLQASVLRPFIFTQEVLAQVRLRAENAVELHAKLDSLAAIVISQAAVVEENRRLREHLGIESRLPDAFVHANLIRPGTEGSESMFLLDVGSDQGVRAGDPVLMRDGRIGLVGVIRDVAGRASIGLDWSHPDFRASAMTAGGETFGLVEPRTGRFPGGDRLLLNAIPYFEPLEPGTLITTSGLGGVFPRGIPIGEVLYLHDEEGRWRSEYWLRPLVDPASVTHVLVVNTHRYADSLLAMLEGLGEAQFPDSFQLLPDSAILIPDSDTSVMDSVSLLPDPFLPDSGGRP